MKHKLINIVTIETHLCEKIEIDGFYYYVNDETAKDGDKLYLLRNNLLGNVGDIITVVSTEAYRTDIIKANGEKHWFASDTEYQKEWNWKKVIATNNPNIDCHKVVDEVEYLALSYEMSFIDDDGTTIVDFKEGYNKAKETYPFSEKEMIEFADFVEKSNYDSDGFTQHQTPQGTPPTFQTTTTKNNLF